MTTARTLRKVDAVIATCERAGFTREDWALLAQVAASQAGVTSKELRGIGDAVEGAARPKRRRRR